MGDVITIKSAVPDDRMDREEMAKTILGLRVDLGALPRNRQLPVARLLDRIERDWPIMDVNPRWTLGQIRKEIDAERLKSAERRALLEAEEKGRS